ncbi:hypothetical protein Tco_0136032, partial [Tanacetum coccineum]
MTDNMIAKIPIDVKAKYTPTDGDPLPDPSLYRTIVGSLVYLTVILLMLSKLLISLLLLQLQYIGLLSYRFFSIFVRFAYLVESKKQDVLSNSSKLSIKPWLLIVAGTISLPFVSSSLQIADILTKPHCGPRFRFLSDKLSMFLAAP